MSGRVVAATVILLSAAILAHGQKRHALLIGINTYQPPGTTAEHPAGCTYGRCELGSFQNLAGSVNDAQAMADLLVSKFGFPAKQVVLLTNPLVAHPAAGMLILPSEQTDRAGILAAMQKYLVDVPQPGDTVVFYVASHGSLRVNSQGTKLTVSLNGQLVHADSTVVPSDAYKGGYDVRDREMTRIYDTALNKGVHLTIILDSCHSGGISRGIGLKYTERALAFDPRDIHEAPDATHKPPTEREDNPALVFSAVQQDESAREVSSGGEVHGAFTAALVQALEVLPADTPASVVYERVKAVLEGGNVPDEDPDLDGNEARRRQPLFGGIAAPPGRLRTAAIATADDGSVVLDLGRVASVGVGSEFSSILPNGSGKHVQLRLIELDGIARSRAEVMSPVGAKVQPGDVFEMTRWHPAESAPLLVWHWPANLSAQQITMAVQQLRASGIASVADPADEPWTHMLGWDGTNWLLQAAGATDFTVLGPTLTAKALQRLPVGAKTWVNLPPPSELTAQLTPADPTRAVRPANDLAEAHYALTGVLTPNGPAYAWFQKNELANGPSVAGAANHSPGCSANSPYPVRTDWVSLNNARDATEAGRSLNHLATQLAKVHDWLELANSPADGSTEEYYKLELLAGSGTVITEEQPMHAGDRMTMALRTQAEIRERRWVYVLDIDCHGQGTLLYPLDYSENRFPNDATMGTEFPLPGAKPLQVGPPYGVDTMILLSTAEPLPDPYVLNFEGIARSTRGVESALEQLLSNASSGTRGAPAALPTSWGISVTTVRSVPRARQ